MTKAFFRQVMWVGRAATFCVGLAVVLAVAFGVGTTALAAVPGDPFKLGRLNTVDRITSLTGGAAGPLLRVDNNGGGPALALKSEAGRAPLTVNAGAGKAANLDADRLDGTDSDDFMSYLTRYVTARTAEDSSETKTVTAACPEGELALSGRASVGTDRATHELTRVPPAALHSAGPLGGSRWSATARETEAYDLGWHLKVTAYCVEAPPDLVPAGQ